MPSAYRPWYLLVVLGFALAAPAHVHAQQIGDMDSLSKAFDANATRRKELFDGVVTASGAADKKIAEACARWYLARITHSTVLQNPAALLKVHNEFINQVSYLMDAKLRVKNRSFIDLFGPALVDVMKEALAVNASGRPEVVINAGMMMPTMARLKQDAIGDYLVGLAGDPKTEEVVRLHALKALREFFPADSLDQNSDLADKKVLAKKARDIKYIDTLVKFIETPIKTDGLHPEEAAAVNFIRREAIISLAQVEVPAVMALKKYGKVEGAAAPALMRVAAGNLDPAPTLQEKVEAAIGLCKMKYWNPAGDAKIRHAHIDEYQPEVAVYLVGKTLSEFIGAYKSDYEYFSLKDKTRKLPRVPFKIDAKRFEFALGELANNAKGATAKADTLKTGAAPILLKMIAYQQVEIDQEFRSKTVPSLRPKNGYAFKNLKVAEIPLD